MKESMKRFIIIGLLVSVFIALFVSPFASPFPDGLEKVAERQHFLKLGEKLVWKHSPLADYLFPGIRNERLATGLAGLTGTIAVFIIAYAIALGFKKISGKDRRDRKNDNFKNENGDLGRQNW